MSSQDQADQPAQPPRALAPLVRHSRAVFRVYVGAQIAMSLFAAVMAVIFLRAADSRYISEAFATGLDIAGAGSAILYLVVLIWTIVLVLRFTFRAMKNLRLRGEATSMSPTMAVVWYFIPFALLFMPYQGMKEIWVKSRARAQLDTENARHLLSWWLTWIVGGVLGNVTFRMVGFGDDASLEMLAASNGIDAVSGLIHVVSALLLLRIMTEVSTAQDQELN